MGKFGALTSLVRAVFSKQPTTTVQLAVIPELAHIKKGLQKYFNSIPAPTAAPTQSAQPRTAQYTSSTISSHSTFSAGFYSDASSDRSVAVVQTTSQHPETDVSALVLLTLTHGVASIYYDVNDLAALRKFITLYDDTQWGDANDEYFMLNAIALEKSMDAYIRENTWQQQTYTARIIYLYITAVFWPYSSVFLSLTSMSVTADSATITYTPPFTSTVFTATGAHLIEALDIANEHLLELDGPRYGERLAQKLIERSERERLANKARKSRFVPGLPIPADLQAEYDEHDDDGYTIYGDVTTPDSEKSIFFKSSNSSKESAELISGNNTSSTSLEIGASSVSRSSIQELNYKCVSPKASNEAVANMSIASAQPPIWMNIFDAPITSAFIECVDDLVEAPVFSLPQDSTVTSQGKPQRTAFQGAVHKAKKIFIAVSK